MASAPLPPRHRADRERHAQAIALIMGRAAHLRMIPWPPEVLRAPRRVGLETAAAEDNGTRFEQAHGRGAITNLDAEALRQREPHPREPHALVYRAHDRALGPLDHATDLYRAERYRRLEAQTVGGHPRGGRVGFVDQQRR